MLQDYYHIAISPDFLDYEFVSIGPKGAITKVVRYREINVKEIYNLGFGDKEAETGFVNDLTLTNNSDSPKVLATVARTLYLFTNHYPEASVIATGSTAARTRLYRMGITTNLTAVEEDFQVLGLTQTGWEPFRKNVTYLAFWVRRKTVNL